jgi:hypothetical protein
MFTVRARMNVFRLVVDLFPSRAGAKLDMNVTHMRNKKCILYSSYLKKVSAYRWTREGPDNDSHNKEAAPRGHGGPPCPDCTTIRNQTDQQAFGKLFFCKVNTD